MALELFVQMKPYLEVQYVKQISKELPGLRVGVGDLDAALPPRRKLRVRFENHGFRKSSGLECRGPTRAGHL